jgi:hypothetical protein
MIWKGVHEICGVESIDVLPRAVYVEGKQLMRETVEVVSYKTHCESR